MDTNKEKWYLKTSIFVLALLCVGPLALPLLWINPQYSIKMKVFISAAVIILTYYMVVVTFASIKNIMSYYSQLGF